MECGNQDVGVEDDPHSASGPTMRTAAALDRCRYRALAQPVRRSLCLPMSEELVPSPASLRVLAEGLPQQFAPRPPLLFCQTIHLARELGLQRYGHRPSHAHGHRVTLSLTRQRGGTRRELSQALARSARPVSAGVMVRVAPRGRVPRWRGDAAPELVLDMPCPSLWAVHSTRQRVRSRQNSGMSDRHASASGVHVKITSVPVRSLSTCP